MREPPWWKLGAALALVAVAVGITLVVRGGQALPDEVQPITWHKQPCAHCQMLVGEPAFAAQLITTDGAVLAFDDPGCAFRYLAERNPGIHHLWFHHAHTDRWLDQAEVAFQPGAITPMSFGLAAVDRATPSALSFEAARAEVAAKASGLAPAGAASGPGHGLHEVHP